MKKYLLLTCLAAMLSVLATAQQFGADVRIQDTTVVNQTRVKLSTAFNGWQYAAMSTIDTSTNLGGIGIRMSRDNGNTWTWIVNVSFPTTIFPSIDLVVAGTDTNNLLLYVTGINNNINLNTYTLFVDEIDARTGAYIGEPVHVTNSAGPIYDVAISSDYMSPSIASSPYSVGVLYSTYSISTDSIIYLASLDGGATWSVDQTVMTTTNYFRKVSISYGQSASGSNGRYFGAWEMLQSAGSNTGNIYSSHSSVDVSSSWNAPVNLDSVSVTTIGLCRNPSIATSFGNTDNDSSGVTAIVLVDNDFTGTGTDYDLVGFYNKVAHFSDFWTWLSVSSSTDNEIEPKVTYCEAASKFFCTFFDSTIQFLPYAQNDFNLVNASTWTYITTWYNDFPGNLTNPYPQVSVNPVVNMASFAWIQSTGTNTLAFYDAEYSTVSVAPVDKSQSGLSLYPNPAIHDINVAVTLKSPSRIWVNIFNSIGQLMLNEDLGSVDAGTSNHLINVESLAGGNYFVRVTGDRFVKTEQMMISK